MSGITSRDPVFLLGIPRSGTTLLARLLTNHPEVMAPPEPWIMLAIEQLGCVDRRHPADCQLVGQATDEFLDDSLRIEVARAAARAAYDGHLQRAGKSVFVDKTPRYHLIVPFLRRVFPSANFLVLLRNPLAIAASFHDTWNIDVAKILREGRDHPAAFDVVQGLGVLADLVATDDPRVHSIRYEDLVRAPNTVMPQVFDFLGLDPLAVPENSMATIPFAPPSALGDQKINKEKVVHDLSIDMWRESLSDADKEAIADALGADTLRRLGYGKLYDEFGSPGQADPDRISGERLASRWHDLALVRGRGRPLGDHLQANSAAALHNDSDLAQNVAVLSAALADREADSVARGLQIEELTALIREIEIDRAACGSQIEELTALIKEIEIDRAARGRQIEELTALIKEIEIDRAARGSQIEELTALIKEIEVNRAAQG
ncbi:sulfotransferase family protein [Paramagnetospirillum magneticum]|uniref:Nodulation protein noeE n=1 Tax=Paramagnetospirillum magneticum (strain ATCC 700264 / AMB-1) TaxID=342108 RepID=Q2W8G0_PARM1|nr:sulfotransferase [Paramagnetospirillum magneticum]BAE49865.1 Nodulation protein noeE [Paramagnetospirillum magneticum AMB-1]